MKRDELSSSTLIETVAALESDIASSRMARKALLRHGNIVEFLDRAGVIESIEATACPIIFCKAFPHLTKPELEAAFQFLGNHAEKARWGDQYSFTKPSLRVIFKEN